jgi:hypothetical protein
MVQAAADAVLAAWPEIERDTDLGQALRDCAITLKERHSAQLWAPDVHPVLFRAGRSLGECGLVSVAVHYWTQISTEATDTLGTDHPDTLTTRHDLAYWQGRGHDQGNHDDRISGAPLFISADADASRQVGNWTRQALRGEGFDGAG